MRKPSVRNYWDNTELAFRTPCSGQRIGSSAIVTKVVNMPRYKKIKGAHQIIATANNQIIIPHGAVIQIGQKQFQCHNGVLKIFVKNDEQQQHVRDRGVVPSGRQRPQQGFCYG